MKYVDSESLVAHQARVRHADPANRTFNYAMIGGARFMAASAWRLVLIKFLAQMNPAADVLALASLEVDISKLNTGICTHLGCVPINKALHRSTWRSRRTRTWKR